MSKLLCNIFPSVHNEFQYLQYLYFFDKNLPSASDSALFQLFPVTMTILLQLFKA